MKKKHLEEDSKIRNPQFPPGHQALPFLDKSNRPTIRTAPRVRSRRRAEGLCVWVSDLMGTYGFHKPLHMGDDQPHMKQFPVGAKSFDWALDYP